MPRSFDRSLLRVGAAPGPRFWLLTTGAILLACNLVAIFLLVFPPGGTQEELQQQRFDLHGEIAAARATAVRLRTVSSKVEVGSEQAAAFETQYFLPERVAYATVIAEIQRMAKASGVEEREAVYSKEAIEGSDDLSMLNVAARFQGGYPALMQFLHESDTSPMMLMLDTLQATPQQKGGLIDSEIRFQTIIREDANGVTAGGQP